MQVKTTQKQRTLYSIIAIAGILVLVYIGDLFIGPASSFKMMITVIEKGAIYALVAASMNLLNGFTGLFRACPRESQRLTTELRHR